MKNELRGDRRTTVVGYLVSAWPRLSETFILNEVLAAERQGAVLRIFSLKDPGPAPVHQKVRRVQTPVRCLPGGFYCWIAAILPGLRLLSRHPVRFFQALLLLFRYVRHVRLRRFAQAVCLADILTRQPVAHLHAHFTHAPAVVAMFAAKLTGIPYTFTAHAKDIYVKTPAAVLRAEIRQARAVVTCTECNRQFLMLMEDPGPPAASKIRRIYHGLDLSEFDFHFPREQVEDPPLILSVARLVEKKGLAELIAASRLLRARGRRFRVEIIGDGPLRQSLQNCVAEFGMRDHIKLRGALAHEEVRAAYARASAFALPCVVAADGDRDGIPNVLLEAMASGVPVVSTPVSGIPELIEAGQEGLLVEPGNPESLAEALDQLLSDARLCERLARAARARIEAFFSADRNCAQLLELFRNDRLGTEREQTARQEVPAPVQSAPAAPLEDRRVA